MLRESIVSLGLVALGVGTVSADVLQLKDKATITGKILTEKPDQVVVDVGYTVLVVPRNQIIKVSKSVEGAATNAAPVVPTTTITSKSGDYTVATTPPALKSVRELVNQLGESVVQVRTPGGLGSGFIINEDGYLITNFHVIEGETQISVEVYHQTGGELERKSYKQVRIIAINKFGDLALLKIDDKDAPRFKSVLLGSADALAVGEGVFAIGSPLGLERTVTEGILSTKTRQ